MGLKTNMKPDYISMLRTVTLQKYFSPFKTMWEKQILGRAIGIQKETWR